MGLGEGRRLPSHGPTGKAVEAAVLAQGTSLKLARRPCPHTVKGAPPPKFPKKALEEEFHSHPRPITLTSPALYVAIYLK